MTRVVFGMSGAVPPRCFTHLQRAVHGSEVWAVPTGFWQQHPPGNKSLLVQRRETVQCWWFVSVEITGRNCDWAFEVKGPDSRGCQTHIKSNTKTGTFVQIFSINLLLGASKQRHYWCFSSFTLWPNGGIKNKGHFIVFRFSCDVRQLKSIKAIQTECAQVRGERLLNICRWDDDDHTFK